MTAKWLCLQKAQLTKLARVPQCAFLSQQEIRMCNSATVRIVDVGSMPPDATNAVGSMGLFQDLILLGAFMLITGTTNYSVN